MELWDLYDADRKQLGRTRERGKLNAGEYHVVVEIWTVDNGGNILLTLRSPEKDMYPNTWECTGGSALVGESSIAAAVRELFQETGISASEEELILIDSERGDSAFFDVYILRRDTPLSELVFQQGETVDARWVTMEEFETIYSDGTFAFPNERRIEALRAELETRAHM